MEHSAADIEQHRVRHVSNHNLLDVIRAPVNCRHYQQHAGHPYKFGSTPVDIIKCVVHGVLNDQRNGKRRKAERQDGDQAEDNLLFVRRNKSEEALEHLPVKRRSKYIVHVQVLTRR